MSDIGTITSRETKDVFRDVLIAKKVQGLPYQLLIFEITKMATSKKPRESRWAPPIAVAKRRGVPDMAS